jgi:tetratricopeptide (TPR) repeat protein
VIAAPTAKLLSTEMVTIREFVEAKDFKTARAALIEVNKEFPNDADVNNLLGFTSRKLKMYSSSATYYTKALSINPKHLGALEYQGELFIVMKKVPLAKKNLAKLKALCGVKCEEYLDLKKAIGKK